MYAWRSTWHATPVYNLVLEILDKKGGIAKDIEIYEMLRDRIPISFMDFLKALLDLEVRGVIKVQLISEDLRTVEMIR